MSWTSTDILGSDLTKDFHYEILKIVCGTERASSYIVNDTIAVSVVTNENKQRFIDNLAAIYGMCKSLNKIEETWQMQVLANFMLHNRDYCTPYVNTESARVLWNNFNYEFENINFFGWQSDFNKIERRNKLKELYDSFGRISWSGLGYPNYFPFGSSSTHRTVNAPAAVSGAYNPYAPTITIPVCDILPVVPPPAIVPPGHREHVIVRTNCGPIQHAILNVIQDWVKYTVDNKQWSYRTLRTDRGYLLQTRWGSINTSTSRLRLTSKAFTGIYSMNTALRTTLRRKQSNGYTQVRAF